MCFSSKNGVIRLSGSLTPDNVITVRQKGEAYIAEHAEKNLTPIRLDLNELKTTSTLSISLLFCWLRSAKKHGVRLHLPEQPIKLKSLADMHNISSIFNDLQKTDNTK